MKVEIQEAPEEVNILWSNIQREARELAAKEPALGSFIHATIFNHTSLPAALAFHLAGKLGSAELPAMLIQEIIEQVYSSNPAICKSAELDMLAVRTRDAACEDYLSPLLFFKGYHALQSYRIAHALWLQGRTTLAFYIQNTSSTRFDVDIHPAARIGQGILLDHASGVVVGETTVIEDDVSMLQNVTLGGTGKQTGDRHPKVRRGVLLGAGAKVLGNIEIGEGAKIGAGSVVVRDVPPHCTAVGVPAKVIGGTEDAVPALTMDHSLEPTATKS